MKKVFLIAIVTLSLSIVSVAQDRKPSEPTKPYVVKTKQEFEAVEKALHSIDKDIKTKDLVDRKSVV